MCQLEALSGFAQGSALDLSQNGIGHFGIPRQHIRLDHVSTLLVGCHGNCGSGRSSNINTVYEQRRVDLAIFRAVPASTWGHCPQVLCFTTVWDTPGKEKVAKWSAAPASILEGFNEIYAVYGPKKPCKTRGKRQSCQIDPCLPPYTSTLPFSPTDHHAK